jgi:hypothetical protein
MEYENLRKQVVDAGLKMFRMGMTHGSSGNISCRVPDKENCKHVWGRWVRNLPYPDERTCKLCGESDQSL